MGFMTFCLQFGTRQEDIAQGCPLSPYLFIIVLTVIFNDVDTETENRPDLFLQGALNMTLDISYADDTFLTAKNPDALERYLHVVITSARKYGLEPNWKKTLHMPLRHVTPIHTLMEPL